MLTEAKNLIAGLADKSGAARVLNEIGSAHAIQYLNHKMTFLRDSKIDQWMKRFALDTHFGFTRAERNQLNRMKTACVDSFKLAASFFRSSGDEEGEAYSLYHLALWLKTFYRFRKATSVLTRANQLARKKNVTELLAKIPVVENSIRMKNRDIPNYAEGESR